MTIDLDSDDLVRERIRRATAGDQSAAWFLIQQIQIALQRRVVSEPLFDYAAEFFQALRNIQAERQDSADARDLAKALDRLHLVQTGRRPRGRREQIKLAGTVTLLARCGFSNDRALGALEVLNEEPRKAYRTATEQWGAQLQQHCTVDELEDFAETTVDDLLKKLAECGAIRAQDAQDAARAAESAREQLRRAAGIDTNDAPPD